MQITVDDVAYAMASVLLCAEVDPGKPDAAIDAWRAANIGGGAILAFGEAAIREATLLREKRRGASPAVLDTLKRMLEAQAELRLAGANPDLPKTIIERARHRLGLLPRVRDQEDRQP